MPRIKLKKDLPDIQEETGGFPKKKIKKVGIRNVIVPISVIKKDNTINQTTANISIYTNLSSKVKGSNMSRYRIVLEEYLLDKKLNLRDFLREVLQATKSRLGATDAYIKIKFDYFLVKEAPASKIKSYMNYRCYIEGNLNNNIETFYLNVAIPYTSLCPCSKKISDYGAHNQRSVADVKVELIEGQMCWIEDIIEVVESIASAPIINGLKREDEAYQTEEMYENPQFVEDMVRNIATKLDENQLDKTIKDYVIVANHFESIHTHDATAIITAGRNLQ
jgi:GTP cyclohydrolase IB